MRNGAYAEICGELREDIVVKGDEEGLICGLIYVLINANIDDQLEEANSEPTYIPVLLKGVNIIKKHGGALKKGCRVWLVGKFEIVENAYLMFEEFGFENISGVIINLHDKNRLIILPKEREILSVTPQNDNQVINTGEFNARCESWAANFN